MQPQALHKKLYQFPRKRRWWVTRQSKVSRHPKAPKSEWGILVCAMFSTITQRLLGNKFLCHEKRFTAKVSFTILDILLKCSSTVFKSIFSIICRSHGFSLVSDKWVIEGVSKAALPVLVRVPLGLFCLLGCDTSTRATGPPSSYGCFCISLLQSAHCQVNNTGNS
jgi:hypothetical protein